MPIAAASSSVAPPSSDATMPAVALSPARQCRSVLPRQRQARWPWSGPPGRAGCLLRPESRKPIADSAPPARLGRLNRRLMRQHVSHRRPGQFQAIAFERRIAEVAQMRRLSTKISFSGDCSPSSAIVARTASLTTPQFVSLIWSRTINPSDVRKTSRPRVDRRPRSRDRRAGRALARPPIQLAPTAVGLRSHRLRVRGVNRSRRKIR